MSVNFGLDDSEEAREREGKIKARRFGERTGEDNKSEAVEILEFKAQV